MRNLSSQALAACVLAIAGIVPASAAQAAQPDVTGVQQANDKFYVALNEMFKGNHQPM